ncbi:undecaprenyldiphospho-muramoylpentapeptide beta-N-acetylglucosaminyltransferase [Alicyclobacillus tolerans]|uniref:undecaprenyldiphospho-muramoylpentapeptide beta-N-acetylglucosaminyltransferase n=1 Tax=Alicyclobacillus tolerans TaxID=90970 RepID=UPI001F61CD68|nr:undecaprenyldiphospho-muramoylpentapeptide beta-N-acetylglucosaminyltransferase [Alicyclobacillus montanus]
MNFKVGGVSDLRLLLTGGGTGGHIYPAISIARELERRGELDEVLYIGTEKGLEKNIVAHAGLPFTVIQAAGLKREISAAALQTAWITWRGYRESLQVIRRFKPDVVLGTGGYVTLPVIFAAHRLRKPSVVWEGNAFPGLTNLLCARRADVVAVAMEETIKKFPRARRVVWTGHPRASEIRQADEAAKEAARKRYQLRPGYKHILVFCGSRGAETVNRVVLEMAREFLAGKPNLQMIVVTGEHNFVKMENQPDNLLLVPFVDDMPALLPQMDVVVTRAGAGTVAEIASLGIPAVFIPSPYVTANHQEVNARFLTDRGGGTILLEKELTSAKLWLAIQSYLKSEPWQRAHEALLSCAIPDAVEKLVQVVQETAYSQS